MLGEVTVLQYWKNQALLEKAKLIAQEDFAKEMGVCKGENEITGDVSGEMMDEKKHRTYSKDGIIYGLKEYTEQSYYSYLTSNLKNETVRAMGSQEEWQPTQEELEEVYVMEQELWETGDTRRKCFCG